ncbi:MAG: hypothetical protein H7Y19_03855, partial [Luteimonas sp.]|nr:hypothetical protein [Luteimonas sp.]
RRSRGQSQRAAIRTPARISEAPAVAAVASAPVLAPVMGNAGANVDPFGAQALTAPSRPWPRAILPNFPATGALAVDYGNSGASSFYPFEPRVAAPVDAPAEDSASDQEGSTSEPPPQP